MGTIFEEKCTVDVVSGRVRGGTVVVVVVELAGAEVDGLEVVVERATAWSAAARIRARAVGLRRFVWSAKWRPRTTPATTRQAIPTTSPAGTRRRRRRRWRARRRGNE